MDNESDYVRACCESLIGNTDEALRLLERAIAQIPGARNRARHDPDFESLYTEARFMALVGQS